MITVDALKTLLVSKIRPLPLRHVHLSQARGLILANDVLADSDEPAFDRSAMDGFAIPKESPPGHFKIIGESLPGGPVPQTISTGEALRVFTGSALPPGVRVVMQEDVSIHGTTIEINKLTPAIHVRQRGSAKKRGDMLLTAGTRLHPAALAVLAGAGQTTPLVHPRPTVAHITTGIEVIEPSKTPIQGQIRDTNGTLIRALLEESGATFLAHQHTGENPDQMLQLCGQIPFKDADMLLISGGSSGGAHDHTAKIIEALGYALICNKVNCRPGKPLLIGIRDDKVAVGLPGNPVSHFVTFHLFVRQILSQQSGAQAPQWATAALHNPDQVGTDSRETFWPACLRENALHALPWLDSGHLSALLDVNALIRVPPGRKPHSKETVEYLTCGAA